MYSISFNLKHPKSGKPSLIYMYVFLNKDRIKISTSQKLFPALWDKSKKAVTRNRRIIDDHEARQAGTKETLLRVQERLNTLQNEVERYDMTCALRGTQFSLVDLREQLVARL